MRRPALLACSGLFILAACGEATEPAAPGEGAPIAVAPAPAAGSEAAAADTGRKFFGRQAFTIVMMRSGREAGTITYHYRDWGRRSAELSKLTNSLTGEKTDTRVFTEGAVSVTIDNLTGKVEVFENPYYNEEPAGVASPAPDAFASAAMADMGAEKLDESDVIAGEACEYWQVMGAKKCIAAWGPTLHSLMKMGDVSGEMKAVEIRVGDGGPDSAFVYEPPVADAPVTEGE